MKVRNELNVLLYSKKMGNYKIPEHLTQYSKFASVVGGETDTVKAELKNGALALLSNERVLSKNSLKNAVYHFVIAALAISSACIDTGLGQTEAYTLTDLYVMKVDECRTVDGVCRLYEDMCLDFAERMQDSKKPFKVSLRFSSETMIAYVTARALDSVAVHIPLMIEPIIMTGISRAGRVSFKEARISFPAERFSR